MSLPPAPPVKQSLRVVADLSAQCVSPKQKVTRLINCILGGKHSEPNVTLFQHGPPETMPSLSTTSIAGVQLNIQGATDASTDLPVNKITVEMMPEMIDYETYQSIVVAIGHFDSCLESAAKFAGLNERPDPTVGLGVVCQKTRTWSTFVQDQEGERHELLANIESVKLLGEVQNPDPRKGWEGLNPAAPDTRGSLSQTVEVTEDYNANSILTIEQEFHLTMAFLLQTSSTCNYQYLHPTPFNFQSAFSNLDPSSNSVCMADNEPPNEPTPAQEDQPIKRRGQKKGSKNTPDAEKGLYGKWPVGRPRKVPKEVHTGLPDTALSIDAQSNTASQNNACLLTTGRNHSRSPTLRLQQNLVDSFNYKAFSDVILINQESQRKLVINASFRDLTSHLLSGLAKCHGMIWQSQWLPTQTTCNFMICSLLLLLNYRCTLVPPESPATVRADLSELNDCSVANDGPNNDNNNKCGSDSELDDDFPEDEFDDWEDDESAQQGCDLAQHVVSSAPAGDSASLHSHNPSQRGGPGKSCASIPTWIEVYYADFIVTLETEIRNNPS
ncbi:uncharacterized protein EV420DRAFT_1482319 [Desarmillaria tabescens]|uniref:Uncharacterized protein n=1 Tax=Armillaria tabescens TaxID=1929756 RepID=A0AA39K205_ARMTA|nr:uncharacterized protein EV420DRAFT_1482319 [Desarmillaria tabescens]KAK0451980.1 hypothetical protein EV420DRAFT_1482319 [Desarmillaria tabescens]